MASNFLSSDSKMPEDMESSASLFAPGASIYDPYWMCYQSQRIKSVPHCSEQVWAPHAVPRCQGSQHQLPSILSLALYLRRRRCSCCVSSLFHPLPALKPPDVVVSLALEPPAVITPYLNFTFNRLKGSNSLRLRATLTTLIMMVRKGHHSGRLNAN